jgi:hypothetical protein
MFPSNVFMTCCVMGSGAYIESTTTYHKLRRDGASSLRRHIHSSWKEDTEAGEARIAPTRRAFPLMIFDHLTYFHNGSRRRENRPDTSVLLFSSISYATRSWLFLFLSHPPALRRAPSNVFIACCVMGSGAYSESTNVSLQCPNVFFLMVQENNIFLSYIFLP